MANDRIDRSKIGKRSKQRGAEEERTVARILTEQTGQVFTRVGNRGTTSADLISDEYCVEVKSRTQATPLLIREAQKQLDIAMEETEKDGFIILRYKDNGKRTTWFVKQIID